MLIANSNLVPQWATWEHFRELDAAGLMMYGQMTAGSWIYIGTQGILQGTYETFAAVARKRFGGTLARAARGDRRPRRHGRRPAAGGDHERRLRAVRRGRPAAHRAPHRDRLPRRARRPTSTTRWRRLDAARGRREALSIGLLGNAAEVLPELVRRGAAIDVVTDQTSAHDPLNGYVPAGLTVEQADALRASDPDEYLRRVGESARRARRRHPRCCRRPAPRPSTTATRCAGSPPAHGDADAFAYPGFVPAYIRPLFCEGKGPFRWVALSGDPADIHATDDAILDLFGDQEHIARWIALARERVHFQGLPARICWLGYGERDRAGRALQRDGRQRRAARRRSSSGATTSTPARSPRPSARPRRCATAPTRSPTGRCSTRWSTSPAAPRGSRSTTAAASAWGSRSTPGRCAWPTAPPEAGERIRRVLTADPGMGIVRHADAGEPLAVEAAERSGVRMPMLDPA